MSSRSADVESPASLPEPIEFPIGTEHAEGNSNVGSGLFSTGPATIIFSGFARFKYGATSNPVVWLVRFRRDNADLPQGFEDYEQPYGIGNDWALSEDGRLIPLKNQHNLPKSCNAMIYFVASLEKQKCPADLLLGGGRGLVGMQVVVERVVQEARDFKDKPPVIDSYTGKPKVQTILIVDKIVALPGVGKKAKGSTAAPSTRKAAVVEDDDDIPSEPVAKRGRGKPAPEPEPEDADDETAEEDLLESGVEALLGLFEDDDEPVPYKDLEALLLAGLKSNPEGKAIAAFMAKPETLALQRGWVWNAKKKTITLA